MFLTVLKNWGLLLVFLESPQHVRFNEGDSIICKP
jgi:hypothetical protein